MLGADLLGRAHVLNLAAAEGIRLPRDRFAEHFTPLDFETVEGVPKLPFEEAIDFFRTKVPLPAKTVARLVARSEERSAAAAAALTTQVTEQLDAAIAEGLAEGFSLDRFLDQADELLAKAGLDPADPHRLMTIARTNVTQAYSAGRWAQLEDPLLAEAFPYIQFNAVIDGNTTDVCRALHGRVYRRDNPEVQRYIPPNHYQCRLGFTPITAAQAKASGLPIRRTAPPVEPEPGFRHNGATALIGNPLTGL